MLKNFAFLLPIPLLLSGVLVQTSCTTYDVDTSKNATLVGSVKRAVNKQEVRKERPHEKYEQAPVYIDYSKSNPVLRHDDEFEKSKKYEAEDPFEEEVNFSDYKKMKHQQQRKRRMDQDHIIDDKNDAPLSLW